MAILNNTLNLEHFQLKYHTKSEWENSFSNYVLAQGEVALEIDTKKAKLGDGSTTWSELNYYSDPVLDDLISALTDRVGSLEQSTQALSDRVSAIEGITTISVNSNTTQPASEPEGE